MSVPKAVTSLLWIGATACMLAGLLDGDDETRAAGFFLAIAGMTAVLAYTMRWATGVFVCTLSLFIEDVELRGGTARDVWRHYREHSQRTQT